MVIKKRLMTTKVKQDLRVIKTKNAIHRIFKEMVCEMEPQKITIKELTSRALVNRKTFYLHYSSIDGLIEEVIEEIVEGYNEEIENIPMSMSMKDINKVFFSWFGKDDVFIERLICAPSYREFSNKLFTITLQNNRKRYNTYAHLSKEKQSLINNFLSNSTLELYRQWIKDNKQLPLNDLTQLVEGLLTKGLSSIL